MPNKRAQEGAGIYRALDVMEHTNITSEIGAVKSFLEVTAGCFVGPDGKENLSDDFLFLVCDAQGHLQAALDILKEGDAAPEYTRNKAPEGRTIRRLTGVTPAHIEKTQERWTAICDGKIDIHVSELVAIANALDVNPYSLICPDDLGESDLVLLDNFLRLLTAKDRGIPFEAVKQLIGAMIASDDTERRGAHPAKSGAENTTGVPT